jgi:hypothetical protein
MRTQRVAQTLNAADRVRSGLELRVGERQQEHQVADLRQLRPDLSIRFPPRGAAQTFDTGFQRAGRAGVARARCADDCGAAFGRRAERHGEQNPQHNAEQSSEQHEELPEITPER